MTVRIEVAKSSIYSEMTRRTKPYYECTGPDGTRFDNTSFSTLVDILHRKYGRDIEIDVKAHDAVQGGSK